jgi:methionyl-tRNA formyltransferase
MADSPLRIVFAGTPEFAVASLQALHSAGHKICAVYTQPDRPAGRGRQLSASPIKRQAMGLPVLQPTSLRDRDVQNQLAAWQADLMVVVAYGLLLPAAVLAIPRLGCINVHASLLPRWRGAAPIQRALLAGDKESGITLMQMDAGLDTGSILAQTVQPITNTMTGGELHDQLALLGAQMLVRLLPKLAAGQVTPQPQDNALASYAPKLEKAEAELDWSCSAVDLMRQVLAFNPWPVAQTQAGGRILRIWQAEAPTALSATDAVPGTVIGETPAGIDVATGAGVLRLTKLQVPGKRPLPVADFINAYQLMGQQLGNNAGLRR